MQKKMVKLLKKKKNLQKNDKFPILCFFQIGYSVYNLYSAYNEYQEIKDFTHKTKIKWIILTKNQKIQKMILN